MITPPFGTHCYYVANLKGVTAKAIMDFLAPSSGDAIEAGLITSKNFESDIEAIHEMQRGAESLFRECFSHEPIHWITKFNPLYLPTVNKLLENTVEVNHDGEITSVAGFSSPFIAISTHIGTDDAPNAIRAHVSFQQFELPPFVEMFESRETS